MIKNLSIVIPVYNSEQSLSELAKRLEPVCKSIADQYELIFINDGSQDKSWDVIRALTVQHPWITGISLMRNFGQHNAILSGVRIAKFDIIVTMDDDLQNPPEEIPRLIEKLNQGHDVVYGKPEVEQHGFFRNVVSKLLKLILKNIMGAKTARNVSAFRAFRTDVRKAFENYRSPFVSFDVLLTWGARNFSYVKVKHDQRALGPSNYTFGKGLAHALNVLTSFSTLPLQLASLMGFVFTLFGLGVLVFVIGRYFIQGGSVPGFTFLASVIAIFAGAQLFALGIMGEYLARIYTRITERPSYVIGEMTSNNENVFEENVTTVKTQ